MHTKLTSYYRRMPKYVSIFVPELDLCLTCVWHSYFFYSCIHVCVCAYVYCLYWNYFMRVVNKFCLLFFCAAATFCLTRLRFCLSKNFRICIRASWLAATFNKNHCWNFYREFSVQFWGKMKKTEDYVKEVYVRNKNPKTLSLIFTLCFLISVFPAFISCCFFNK